MNGLLSAVLVTTAGTVETAILIFAAFMGRRAIAKVDAYTAALDDLGDKITANTLAIELIRTQFHPTIARLDATDANLYNLNISLAVLKTEYANHEGFHARVPHGS